MNFVSSIAHLVNKTLVREIWTRIVPVNRESRKVSNKRITKVVYNE